MKKARQNSLKSMVKEGRAIFNYLPDAFNHVLVHCEEFSCMAYLDEKGIWRSRYSKQPVGGRVIAWEPF